MNTRLLGAMVVVMGLLLYTTHCLGNLLYATSREQCKIDTMNR